MSIEMRRRERGVGAVEILVGVVIGLIGALAMFHVLSTAEGYRRTTSAGSDAQVSGAVSLFSIERDLVHAGYGIGRLAAGWSGCTTAISHPKPAYSGAFAFRPVAIVQGTSSAPSDRVTILAGSSPVHVDPVAIASLDAAKSAIELKTRAGFFAGDLLVAGASSGPGCALVRVDGLDATNLRVVSVGSGAFNQASLPTEIPATGGSVVNLGARPRLVEWYVEGGRLLAVNRLAADPQPLAVGDGVVDLQAQYGVDKNGDAVVDASEWQDAAPATAAEWRGLLSVRVAVLARSGEMERDAVTATAPAWDGGSFDPAAVNPDTWQRFRYRVYQTTAAMRNVMWGRQ